MSTDSANAAGPSPLVVPAFSLNPKQSPRSVAPVNTADLVTGMNAAVERLKQQAIEMLSAETEKMQQSLNQAMAAAGQQAPLGFP